MINKNEMFDKLLEERGYEKEELNSIIVYRILDENKHTKSFINIIPYPYQVDSIGDYNDGIIVEAGDILSVNSIKYIFRKKYQGNMEKNYIDILKELGIL